VGEAMKSTYKEYLQSEQWRQNREKRLQIDGRMCAVCGSKKDLNVHHISYRNIGNENIEKDLITLCHPCHAMLHRIKVQSEEEYKIAVECEQKYKDARVKDARVKALWKKISDLITVEIWLRDRANGGDIDIFDSGCRTVGKLTAIAKMLYANIDFSQLCLHTDIKDALRVARAMKICELYREHKSIAKVAERMNMKPQNVQKVLKRHGFNATGKIT
jgi:hypothetical protein